jgi:polar amino acid transport system substrate-binding protein
VWVKPLIDTKCGFGRRGLRWSWSMPMNKRPMSWLRVPAMALAMLAAAPLVGAVAPAEAQQACAALVITGHPSYPPVAWAAQGKIVGAAPALVSGIAAKLGVKDVVSKDFGSWEGAQAAARDGAADVIFGIYKNDERARTLDFIEPPFMSDPVAIVVRKGAGFAFGQWRDLKGRKGVTNAGESYGDKFDAFMAKELTVVRAKGVDQAFAALLDRQADYLIIGLYPGRDEAKRLGIADKITFLPKALLSSAMYVAFSKKSKCGATLRAGFAADIKAAVDSGKVATLLAAATKSR